VIVIFMSFFKPRFRLGFFIVFWWYLQYSWTCVILNISVVGWYLLF